MGYDSIGNGQFSGIQNFSIYGSNNSMCYTNINNYTDETYLTFIGTFIARQHSDLNIIDQQVFLLNNTNSYQYYVLKIANNWGFSVFMGIRKLQFLQTLLTFYVSVPITLYFVFSDPFVSLPVITPPFNNDTISSETYTGSYITFTWTPSAAGTNLQFQFSDILSSLGIIVSGNITVNNTTIIISVTPMVVMNGISTVMTVIFNNSLIVLPTITYTGSSSNGTISDITYSGAVVSFNWIPSTTGTVTFSFTNITGSVGTLTYGNITVSNTTMLSSLTPLNVSNNIVTNMTAIFSNTLTELPTINPPSGNGTVSLASYNDMVVTFTWLPTTVGSGTFSFANITGTTDTLTSENITIDQVTLVSPLPVTWILPIPVIDATTVIASSIASPTYTGNYNVYYAISPTTLMTGPIENNGWMSATSSDQKIVINFGTQYIATYMILNNGHDSGSNISVLNGIKNFNVYGSNNSICYTNVNNYADETSLTFIGSFIARQHVSMDIIDPQIFILNNSIGYQYYILKIINNWYGANYMTIRKIQFFNMLSNIYESVPSFLCFIFSDLLTNIGLPTIIKPLTGGGNSNGIISSPSYQGNYITFTWTPSASGTTLQFQFGNITTNNITSGNIIVLAQTITISSIIGQAYQGVLGTFIMVFSTTITSLPVNISTSGNGLATVISYNLNTITFTWTPINITNTAITITKINNINGLSVSYTITNILATTILSSLIPITGIYVGISVLMTAIFSNILSILPTITQSSSNGTISGITYTGSTVTFTWIPSVVGTTTIQFSGITGTSNTITSSAITVNNSIILQFNETSYSASTLRFYDIINTNIYLLGVTTYTYNNATIINTMNFVGSVTSTGNYNFNMGTGNWHLFYVFNTSSTITSPGMLIADNTIYAGMPQLSNLSTCNFDSSGTNTITIPTIPINTWVIMHIYRTSTTNYSVYWVDSTTYGTGSGTLTIYNYTYNIPLNITLSAYIEEIQFYSIDISSTMVNTIMTTLKSKWLLVNILSSITPINNIYKGLPVNMTVIFTQSLLTIPTIIQPNGDIGNIIITGNGNKNLTFTWIPMVIGTCSFSFTNVTMSPDMLTSTNITVYPTISLLSLIPVNSLCEFLTCYSGMSNTLTGIFSGTLQVLPTITMNPLNGVISGESYTGNTVTFNWTPSSQNNTLFQFTNIAGSVNTNTIIYNIGGILANLGSIDTQQSIHIYETSLEDIVGQYLVQITIYVGASNRNFILLLYENVNSVYILRGIGPICNSLTTGLQVINWISNGGSSYIANNNYYIGWSDNNTLGGTLTYTITGSNTTVLYTNTGDNTPPSIGGSTSFLNTGTYTYSIQITLTSTTPFTYPKSIGGILSNLGSIDTTMSIHLYEYIINRYNWPIYCANDIIRRNNWYKYYFIII